MQRLPYTALVGTRQPVLGVPFKCRCVLESDTAIDACNVGPMAYGFYLVSNAPTRALLRLSPAYKAGGHVAIGSGLQRMQLRGMQRHCARSDVAPCSPPWSPIRQFGPASPAGARQSSAFLLRVHPAKDSLSTLLGATARSSSDSPWGSTSPECPDTLKQVYGSFFWESLEIHGFHAMSLLQSQKGKEKVTKLNESVFDGDEVSKTS